MKKALVIRCGAYGDMIILSPVFRKLKKLGYKTILHCGDRGVEVLKNNPYIDEIIKYENENEDNPKIQDDWDSVEKKVNPDWFRNFSESIEVNVALHPRSPCYVYSKKKRHKRCGKNYYDATAQWADLDLYRDGRILPELFWEEGELIKAKERLPKGFNILWCLSGSGANKAYPWADYVMGEILKNYDDVNFITVGDEHCQIIETLQDEKIVNLSGKISYRESMAMTHVVDLVISPDTGILHASGSCSVPKIGLLGHTTIENITKYFTHDYSLNADVEKSECAPCYRLIYNHKIQCPIDNLTGAAWCMHHGQPAERLAKRIGEVIEKHSTITRKCDNSIQATMPDMHETIASS